MSRFIARLFSTRTPAATARRPALSLESLETRETPSGLHVSHTLKAVLHLVHQHQAAGIAHTIHHGHVSTSLTLFTRSH